MKTPYIKLYTADILALSRQVTPEQMGLAIISACESAFSNIPMPPPQGADYLPLFQMLEQWKEESCRAYQACKKAGRKGGKKTQMLRQQKTAKIDESPACTTALIPYAKHTETETETNTETETETETEI